MDCAVCGNEIKGGIGIGGVILCRNTCAEDVRAEIDRLRAEGKVVSSGRNLGLVECDVTDHDQRLVARALSTCMTLRGEQAEIDNGKLDHVKSFKRRPR